MGYYEENILSPQSSKSKTTKTKDNNKLKEVRLHTIDLVKCKCDVCGDETYPSILTSVKGKWEFSYICDKCVIKSKATTVKKFKKIKENYLRNLDRSSFVDDSWTKDTDIVELTEFFLAMEQEDSKYINSIELRKASQFVEGLSKGKLLFTKEELLDYYSFYGNDLEVVTTLSALMKMETDDIREKIYNGYKETEKKNSDYVVEEFKTTSNKFIKDTYFHSRTKTLSVEQLEALSRQRIFKFLSQESKEFWENIEILYNTIINGNTINSEGINTELVNKKHYTKVISILETIMNKGYYTKDQRYILDKYIKKLKGVRK